MSRSLARAGGWFLRSGIQEPGGGVARHYRTDLGRNSPVSTEITGYAASAFVYLHSLTGDSACLGGARDAARFLTASLRHGTLPFELDPPVFTYFFDCGIAVRGLLAAWRAAGDTEFLDAAVGLGRSMASDFAAPDGQYHPILSLPDKRPQPYDPLRWSRAPGCYQLKAAMAWWDLWEATGDAAFRALYETALDTALGSYEAFLPGHTDRARVMDRLHAFLYFLEGLLPIADNRRCAAVILQGIHTAARYLRDIAPEFARSDVYAQLLRLRIYAGHRDALAQADAEALATFQTSDPDPRVDGGFYFGRQGGVWLPYVNPVSTAFALQALELWRGAPPYRHLLI